MAESDPQPPQGLSIPMIVDPQGLTPPFDSQNCLKAMTYLMDHMVQSPWRCHFDINVPGGVLELDWWRCGVTAGHALWKWEGITVAATLILTGEDRDDCVAVEHLIHNAASIGFVVPKPLIKRIRENPRPLVGLALGTAPPEIHRPMTEFSIGLSSGLCTQVPIKQPRLPLGTTMWQDFPPRFFHVVVSNGNIVGRIWPDSKAFREIPNLQHVVSTFMDRLDESSESFDERILLRQDKGDLSIRVQWTGLRPTAALAELTDNAKGLHTLLLLSGKDAADEAVVVDGFAASLPHFVAGLFEIPLREIQTGPRPMLLELIGFPLDPEKAGIAGPAAQALAVAFFRRLGVF